MEENYTNEELGFGLVSVEKKKGRIGEFFRSFYDKIGMRGVIVGCSCLLIGTAVVLNFVLFGNSQPSVGEGVAIGDRLGESVSEEKEDDGYFASAQLNRKQARDQAIAVLQTVVASSQDEVTKNQASSDISRIADEIRTEAAIETLICSKGFEECVAVIAEGSASVIVRSDGLLANELSQIKEIVWEQSGIDPINIKIIEKQSA